MNFGQNQSGLMSAFSPLGSEFCDYFYYLSVLNFIILLYILLSALYVFLFENEKKSLFNILLVSLPTFLGYFTNRLLYSICIGTTQQ